VNAEVLSASYPLALKISFASTSRYALAQLMCDVLF